MRSLQAKQMNARLTLADSVELRKKRWVSAYILVLTTSRNERNARKEESKARPAGQAQ